MVLLKALGQNQCLWDLDACYVLKHEVYGVDSLFM